MAGRTSEKGNTTGKTIFCFIGKVIGAGITAFAILALFCVFYYNPPVHDKIRIIFPLFLICFYSIDQYTPEIFKKSLRFS